MCVCVRAGGGGGGGESGRECAGARDHPSAKLTIPLPTPHYSLAHPLNPSTNDCRRGQRHASCDDHAALPRGAAGSGAPCDALWCALRTLRAPAREQGGRLRGGGGGGVWAEAAVCMCGGGVGGLGDGALFGCTVLPPTPSHLPTPPPPHPPNPPCRRRQGGRCAGSAAPAALCAGGGRRVCGGREARHAERCARVGGVSVVCVGA